MVRAIPSVLAPRVPASQYSSHVDVFRSLLASRHDDLRPRFLQSSLHLLAGIGYVACRWGSGVLFGRCRVG
jgi:hypothetical protein